MKRILLAVLAATAIPLAAQASDLDYNYLQAGYDYTHNNNSGNAHGWSALGSAALGQNFQVFGGGIRTDRDFSDTTSNGWNLGAGFHTPISGMTDFVADVDYHQATVDGRSSDAKTYTGELGVRSALAPHFEGWAMAGYGDTHNDVGGFDRDPNEKFFGKLGGQYKFNKNWGLVGEATLSHQGQGYFVGPRFSF